MPATAFLGSSLSRPAGWQLTVPRCTPSSKSCSACVKPAAVGRGGAAGGSVGACVGGSGVALGGGVRIAAEGLADGPTGGAEEAGSLTVPAEQAATTIAAISNSAGAMRNLGISCVSKIVGGPGCYHRAQETRDAGALRADKC